MAALYPSLTHCLQYRSVVSLPLSYLQYGSVVSLPLSYLQYGSAISLPLSYLQYGSFVCLPNPLPVIWLLCIPPSVTCSMAPLYP